MIQNFIEPVDKGKMGFADKFLAILKKGEEK